MSAGWILTGVADSSCNVVHFDVPNCASEETHPIGTCVNDASSANSLFAPSFQDVLVFGIIDNLVNGDDN